MFELSKKYFKQMMPADWTAKENLERMMLGVWTAEEKGLYWTTGY